MLDRPCSRFRILIAINVRAPVIYWPVAFQPETYRLFVLVEFSIVHCFAPLSFFFASLHSFVLAQLGEPVLYKVLLSVFFN